MPVEHCTTDLVAPNNFSSQMSCIHRCVPNTLMVLNMVLILSDRERSLVSLNQKCSYRIINRGLLNNLGN